MGKIVAFAALMIGLAVLWALPVMWLWDYLMPTLFGLKEITFCQALALGVLCSLLFKSSSSS